MGMSSGRCTFSTEELFKFKSRCRLLGAGFFDLRFVWGDYAKVRLVSQVFRFFSANRNVYISSASSFERVLGMTGE